MSIKEWFKRKRKVDKLEELRKKDYESIQKKIEAANDIIRVMKNFTVERRILDTGFDPERRSG